jgi:anti-sigma regulatory factor (Ser/Thr protein kinase)
LTNALRLSLSDRVEEIPPALDRVADFLDLMGASADVIFQFRLALEELLTNASTHGRNAPGLPDPEITVDLDIRDEEAVCEVADNGVAFDPLSAPEPDIDADLDERQIGGIGIHLVRQSMRELTYTRASGRNLVRIVSPLRPDG